MLAVSGELSPRSAGLVSGAVAKALADPGRVLVDVSGLRVTWPPAVQVFPSVLAGAGGWPGARLVLFGPDAGLARSLAALLEALDLGLGGARDERERRVPRVQVRGVRDLVSQKGATDAGPLRYARPPADTW